jgi:hypothetical protein
MKSKSSLALILSLILVPALPAAPISDHPTWAQEQSNAHQIYLKAKEAFDAGDYGKARLLVRQALRIGLGEAERADANELNHEITRRWRAENAHRKDHVTVKDLLPSGSAEELLDRRQQLLGLYGMQDVDGHEGRVGGWVYGQQQAEDYYRASGCEQAAVLAHESFNLRHKAMSWQVWAMIGGAAAGASEV